MAQDTSDTLEVRLALVCYGGVSLAIYMSGITREIQELVTASALRLAPDAGEPSGTAGVYARLIEALEKDAAAHGDPHRIQVGVDIVAGTSAGGINGICLARALDGDYSQEAIRDFWITKADFGQLLDPKVDGLLAKVRAESASLHGLAPQLDRLLDAPPAHPSWFARSKLGRWVHRVGAARRLKDPVIAFVKDPPRSALHGDLMCSLTWEALNGMQKRTRAGEAPFLFAGSGIDLAVTSTEFAGHYDAVPLSHELVFDEAHRHVFRMQGTGGGSLDRDVGMLAFAARATASFPGAFAPVSLDHFRDQVKAAGREADWEDIARRYLRRYPEDRKGIARRFVDGGVLDNMPFDAAIAAIRRRTSQVEVRRALVYVEPSPTLVDTRDPLNLPDLDVREANILAETFRSVSTIPLSQTMGDQIARLRDRNSRVLALRSVIEQRFDGVAKRVDDIAREAAAGGPDPLADSAAEPPAGWWEAVGKTAHESPDLTPTYGRIKIGHVVDRFAEVIADVCGYADGLPRELVGAVMRRAATAAGLLPDVGGRAHPPSELSETQIAFLRAFDVDYERRRIAFVRDGAAWLYSNASNDGPGRARVDAVKHVLFRRAAELERAWDTLAADDELRNRATAVFGGKALRALVPPVEFDPDWDLDTKLTELVAANRADLEALEERARAVLAGVMGAFGAQTFTHLVAALVDWRDGEQARLRADLLRRYIGFPIWDAITYPITVEHEVGERDGQIGLYRVSPRETRVVQPPDGTTPKLAGMATHHFGAFFARPGREQDYLWGRIDGCCQLVALLVDRLRHDGNPSQIDGPAFMRDACAAALEEEWSHVPNARDLATHLWKQVTDRDVPA
jgi:patatin-related protein